jgi:hypothetical protein
VLFGPCRQSSDATVVAFQHVSEVHMLHIKLAMLELG